MPSPHRKSELVRIMLAFGALSLMALGACGRTTTGGSAGEDAAAASGGNLGEGGALPSGGAVGTGGVASSGGATGTGGVASSGGAVGTGGVASSGGAVGTGGNLVRGGTTGTGGGTARGGATGTGGFVVGGSSTNPGGGTATAGMGGRGGTIGSGGAGGQGGVRGSGGAGGWRTGTVVSPRVPTAHRPEAASCVGVNAPPEPSGTTMAGTCKKHADCTQGKNGKCIHGIGGSYNYYSCVYDSCGTDADCDPGKVCFCSPNDAARCLSVGNCRTDADCGGGDYSYCSPSTGMDCGGYHTTDSYHCHTPQDTCIDNSDCTGSGSGSDYCNFDAYDGRWKCQVPNMMCVIG